MQVRERFRQGRHPATLDRLHLRHHDVFRLHVRADALVHHRLFQPPFCQFPDLDGLVIGADQLEVLALGGEPPQTVDAFIDVGGLQVVEFLHVTLQFGHVLVLAALALRHFVLFEENEPAGLVPQRQVLPSLVELQCRDDVLVLGLLHGHAIPEYLGELEVVFPRHHELGSLGVVSHDT